MSCNQIFEICDYDIEDVLRECAELLGSQCRMLLGGSVGVKGHME